MAEKYYSISPYAYCAGDPVNLVDRDGRDLTDVAAGLLIGIRTNLPLGNGEDRDVYSPTDSRDYNNGLRVADAVSFGFGIASMVAGAIETIGGAAGAALGVAAEVPSGGTSTLVVAGGCTLTAKGVAEVTAGATLTMNAVSNGQQGYNRGNKTQENAKSHGKNESHGDGGRAMSKAEKQIEEYKQQLQNATSKKEREEIKHKMQNVTKTAQRKAKGENHSQGNKR